MKVAQRTCASVLVSFLGAVLLARPVSAAEINLVQAPRLTALEQAGRLARLNSRLGAGALYPKGSIVPLLFYQRDYSALWPHVTQRDRAILAERIGNQGRARFAAERGWIKLSGSQGRGIAQGPDAIYWDPSAGRIRVVEAKGGLSPVKSTFGSLQGTNQNMIRSEELVLRSPRTTLAERLASARVIRAAQENRLVSAVVRTPHALGIPASPRLEGAWSRTSVSAEAVQIERKLIRQRPELAPVFRNAAQAHEADLLTYRFRLIQRLPGLSLERFYGMRN